MVSRNLPRLLCVFFLCLGRGLSGTEPDHHEEHETLIDPFTEILEFYNVSSMDVGLLQRLVDDLSAKFQCVDGGIVDGCNSAVCLNATKLVTAFNADSQSITEDVFTEMSTILLHVMSNINSTCGQSLDITAADVPTIKTSVVGQFCECTADQTAGLQGNNNQYAVAACSAICRRSPSDDSVYKTGGSLIQELDALQYFLEKLPFKTTNEENHDDDDDDHDDEDDHDHDHDHDHDDDHADGDDDDHDDDDHMDTNTVAGHDDADSEHDDHAEEGHELIEDKCLGADILLDQLGLDVRGVVDVSETGHLTSLVLLHILKDSSVSRQCRLSPRPGFFTDAIFETFGATEAAMTKEGFERVLEMLSIGGDEHADEDEHVDEHGHRRRRRRRDADNLFENHAWESTCYTADQYFSIFDVDADITREKFGEMCGALVQQKVGGACSMTDTHSSKMKDEPTVTEKYGFGTVCTVVICLCSVFAVLFLRCQDTHAYNYVMDLFVGLAVGTLFTDSMFHLLPMAFGLHGHSDDDGHGHGDAIVVEPFMWHALSTCAGLYAFYLLEKMLSLFGSKHGHSHGATNAAYNPQFSNGKQVSSPDDIEVSVGEDKGSQTKIIGKSEGVSGVVVMVILGDAIHNFADGLALGAAFSSSNSLGFSTAIAVFCHELPHELGDFAVLMTGGLTFCKALMWNLVSSLTAIVGLYIGLAVSTDESVRQWIVGITAGMFLYIALVDLLPQLVKRDGKFNVYSFVLNNVGILLGGLIMFLLAVFEEKIKVD